MIPVAGIIRCGREQYPFEKIEQSIQVENPASYRQPLSPVRLGVRHNVERLHKMMPLNHDAQGEDLGKLRGYIANQFCP